VAYVDQVSGGSVHVIADNYVGPSSNGYTDSGWIPASSVDAFLHPHDLPVEPPPPPLTEANLLRDGGFESGGLGWGVLGPGFVNYTSYANGSAHDGQRYEESNTSAGGGSLYQDVPVNMVQGQSATFSMWARLAPGTTPGGQSVTLCLWALSGGNVAACQNKVLTTAWQQLQATTTMPAATGSLRAQLYESSPGVNYDFDGGSVGAPQTAEAVYGPAATSPPIVAGDPVVGQALTCIGASWANEPTSLVDGWLRDGSPIAGAGAATYALTNADIGHMISCEVSAENDAGSATAVSGQVGPVTLSANLALGAGSTSPSAGPAAKGGVLSSSTRSQCIVPKLRNMTLTQAQMALRRSHCRLGKVHHTSVARQGQRLRVSKQSATPRSRHRSSYTVSVTLTAVR
jgi:hypothetical protein